MTSIEFAEVRVTSGHETTFGPIDVRIGAGERVTVIGHVGVGTMFGLVAGARRPSTGTVRVGGHAADSAAARSIVSTMVDPATLDNDLSLLDHLGRAVGEVQNDDWRSDAVDLARRFGLESRLDDRLITLSRGMRQRLAICMALVRPFDVVAMLEPFAGLDAPGRAQLLDVTSLAHAQGSTVMLGTHDRDAIRSCGRVIALRDGLVVFDGPPDADIEDAVDDW